MAKAGYDVRFLARGAHLQALKTNGLTVKSIHGDFRIPKVNATDSFKEMDKCDLVLVCTKAWQLKEIIPGLQQLVGDNSMVLPLQNGILAAKELSDGIGEWHVLGGICKIISKVESPGVINHFGVDPVIIFGELNKRSSARLESLKTVFANSGIASEISVDIQSEIWKKFITNCLSGLLAITRTTYGELREMPETRQMMVGLLSEIYQLALREGINIESGFVESTMDFIDSFPHNTTSSLTRDVLEGRPSEIEYQNGTVVRLAKKHKLNVPINQFVYTCILPMEIKARNHIG